MTTTSTTIRMMLVILTVSILSMDYWESCNAFHHHHLRDLFHPSYQHQHHQRSSFTSLPIISTTGGSTASTVSPSPHNRHNHHYSITSIRRSSSTSTTTTKLQAVPSSASTSFLVSVASSPVGAISVLAGIILIHEAGHYLAARTFNITVDEFAIGVGPKLVGFTAFGNEFNIRALPLGGYVRFPENYNSTLVQQQQKDAEIAFEERKALENWTVWQEVVNWVTLGYWDERRRRQQRKEKEKAATTPASSGVGTTTYWFQRFGNMGRMKKQPHTNKKKKNSIIDPEDYEIEYYTDPNLLQNRSWSQRAVVLSMGVIFNLLLSFTIYFGIGVGSGLPLPVFDSGVVVSAPPMQNGPSVGLLKQGDIITSINGKSLLPLASKTSALQAQKQVSDIISTIRGTPDGESIVIQVSRPGLESPREVSIQPRRATTVNVKAPTTKSRKAAKAVVDTTSSSPPSIGVYLSPNVLKVENMQSSNPVVAAQLAWQYLCNIYSETLDGILSLISNFVIGNGPPPGQSISGPIGLIKEGSTVVATKDWTAVLLFAAALSVNLGVINALPLPALDGGQLVFVIAEALTGRKVNQRLQEGITTVAVLFLLWASVSAAIGDVGKILSGR